MILYLVAKTGVDLLLAIKRVQRFICLSYDFLARCIREGNILLLLAVL